jgi:2-polyprenyl-3-methyl-5-hydroxy-6-metoxy-1,4-benzoquinol methylase
MNDDFIIKLMTLLDKISNTLDTLYIDYIKQLLKSDEWPVAVNPNLIVESDTDKILRAEGIIDFIFPESLTDEKFLDIGCGEGYPAIRAMEKGAYVVGYDIKKYDWPNNNVYFTTKFEDVVNKGPFDIILLYDTLDHVDNPIEVLQQANSVLKQNGKMFVRTHPYSSKHGSHIYRKINKAYVHLFLNERELEQLGCNSDYVNQIFTPIKTYREWFDTTNLIILNEVITRQPVEDFFTQNNILSNIICKKFGTTEFPLFQLEQQFHDYILGKSICKQ